MKNDVTDAGASAGGKQGLVVAVPFGMEQAQVERLSRRFPSVVFSKLAEDGHVPEPAAGAKVLFRTVMSMEALEAAVAQLPALEWIQTSTSGFNWVMVPSVERRRIRLTRTAHVLSQPIAEHALTLALAVLRRLPDLFRAQQSSTWIRPDIRVLFGSTVVIVGAGAIGRESARRFRALGCTVLGVSRSGTPVAEFDEVYGREQLEALLPRADVLVVACPLTPETRNLIGERELSLLKRDAVLVNVARGEIVSEGPLVEALRTNRIAGAGLDVFSVEPLPPDSPFWSLPNVIVSPHSAFMAAGNHEGVLVEFMENLARYLEGKRLLHELGSWDLGY